MTFVPQNAFERSLVRAANDPSHRPAFYRDLTQSELFVIQRDIRGRKNGRITLKEGEMVHIRRVQHQDKIFIPVFSSLLRLRSFLADESAYLGMSGLDLLNLTKGSALIINPGSDYGKEITAEESAAILSGSLWEPAERYVAGRQVQVRIGQPTIYPQELADSLIRLFKTRKQVKRAWLAQFFNPERDERPHTLIAIEAGMDFGEVLSEAGIIASNVRVPDPPVDFLPITGRGGIESYFLTESKPFYKRASLRFFFG